MSLRTILDSLSSDLKRHWIPAQSFWSNVEQLALSQGIWAIVVYRYGQWVYEPHAFPVRLPLKILYHALNMLVEMNTGIQLPASARIGKGFSIGHFGTIILHADTVMGEHCQVGQGVTIGTKGSGRQGVPVIGDNVVLHPGAKVLGAINIGNNVTIGANAVVSQTVPDNSVVVARPGRVYPKEPAID